MRVTTRGLKVLTTAMLVLCGVMLVLWPMLMSGRPTVEGDVTNAAQLEANKAFAIRFAAYVGLLVFFLVVAAVGAIGIMRRTAAEYREEQMSNMRDLVEATLEDHRRKSNEQPTE